MNDKKIIQRLTEELEEALKPKWISVHDKLPPNQTGVICCCQEGYISEMYFDNDKFGFPRFDAIPDEYDFKFVRTIIGWQPLPPPMERK